MDNYCLLLFYIHLALLTNLFIICPFRQGVPFRTGHDIVGRAVALCVSKGCRLQDLSLDDLKGITPVFDEDVYDYLGVENAVKKFVSYGSTGSECVASQLDFWAAKLGIDRNAYSHSQ